MPFGHVAYIVQANQNTITVLEANFTETLSNGQKHPCWGCVREKTYVIREEQNQRNFAGWLQKR
jgi:surface antigen